MSQEPILFGGTAQITTGACSHRAMASGSDETPVWVDGYGLSSREETISNYGCSVAINPTLIPMIAQAQSFPNKNDTYVLTTTIEILAALLLRIWKHNLNYGCQQATSLLLAWMPTTMYGLDQLTQCSGAEAW
jgi:hypothetical protein